MQGDSRKIHKTNPAFINISIYVDYPIFILLFLSVQITLSHFERQCDTDLRDKLYKDPSSLNLENFSTLSQEE